MRTFATLAAAAAHVILGVHGSADRFDAQTGQRTQIRHVFVDFEQGSSLAQIVSALGPIPMIAINTGSYDSRETATPRGIALGQNDGFLTQLNAVIAAWPGDRFYVRPFPEVNAWWEATCAYNKNGSRRDGAHSTAWTRKAFARIAIIVRGGAQADMDAKLAKLGLPGVSGDLPVTAPKARLVWNPQGFGAPDLPGNSAQAYYPGDEWEAAERLYRAHPSKPFAFPEWGLWGFDDPQFVRAMARWIATHPRTEFVSYFEGHPGSVWDLASKPRSRALYRTLIAPLG